MEVTAPRVVSDIVVEEREKKENGPMSSSIDAKLGFQIRDQGIYWVHARHTYPTSDTTSAKKPSLEEVISSLV